MAIATGFSIAVSGLKAHQLALDVTANNISNASNQDYVRERAVFSNYAPINTIPGDIGMGAKIERIYRITDTFLFSRYTKTSANMQNLQTKEDYIKEIGTYFPDVNDEGLFKNIEDFFNAWQTFASNPNDSSVKVDLAYKTTALTDTIHQLRSKLSDIQKNINDEIKTKVDEANNILKNIAELNKQITEHEANGESMANELRDKRDALEKRLQEILNVDIFRNAIKSQDAQGEVTVDYSENHTISIGGYSLLDGSTYHQLQVVEDKGNYRIEVVNQDFTTTDVTNHITGGEIGALLDVRGREIGDNMQPIDGTIGDLISSLDALSQGIIRSVNSIYSYSAQPSVDTDPLVKTVSISPEMENIPVKFLTDQLYNPVKNGTMTLKAYDDNGNVLKDSNGNDVILRVNISTDDTIKQIIDKINDAINNANSDPNVNIQAQATIVNGQIKLVQTDSNGNPTNHETPNLLVEDDGSLLFSALNEVEYMRIEDINTTRLPIPLEDGQFDVVTYDNDGNELARRTIIVDKSASDPRYSTLEGIIAQINTPNIDDNADNNTSNDVDDKYEAKFINGRFMLLPKEDNIFVGLDNDTVNFGGAIGVNKFFDGKDSQTITLRQDLLENPSDIHAYKAPSDGNNEVANAILQLQYEDIKFYKNGNPYENTITGFYSDTTSALANQADLISKQKDATQSLLTSISNQYYSLAGVNVDEELVNLEKFQRGYQANAKVITTINQMLDALLSIK